MVENQLSHLNEYHLPTSITTYFFHNSQWIPSTMQLLEKVSKWASGCWKVRKLATLA
jgi:hypothetical protein